MLAALKKGSARSGSCGQVVERVHKRGSYCDAARLGEPFLLLLLLLGERQW